MARSETRSKMYGQLNAFEPTEENISTYLERVSLFFDANGVPADKKVSTLLTVIGPGNYGIIRSLVAPALPKEKSYDQLVAVLVNHFQPKPLVIAERYRFYQRCQAPGETVQDFVADLRRLAITCDFGEFLDQALRDRFVCGLKSEQIQKVLLAEDGLTIDRALELAQAKEAAARDAKNFKGSTAPAVAVVHQLPSSDRGPSRGAGGKPCYRCARNGHAPKDCKFRQASCHKCGGVGHIAPACKSKRRANAKGNVCGTKYVESAELSEKPEENLVTFALSVADKSSDSIHIDLLIAGKPLTMELDTGAAVSLISEKAFREMFPKRKLHKSKQVLRTYTAELLSIAGEVTVEVQYGQQSEKLPLVVVKGSGPALFGRNWLQRIKLNWKAIAAVSRSKTLGDVLDKYKDVFKEELGTIHPFTVELSVVPDAKPKFCRARPVPFALRPAVEEELDRLESQGVLEKVDHSEWAAPIVAVPKRDGKIRICGDYKVTVNTVLERDQYPLPRPEDIFASLAGGRQFTTLDLSHAYNQLVLKEESQRYVTINTHRGLYIYKRLPFGISSAPAVFQKTVDTILQGMGKVACYLDDILITGSTEEEHLSNLEEVLRRLQAHGVRLKKDKCHFMESCVEYLGHRIDQHGLHTTDNKLTAIVKAPTPRSVQELRSFLGLLNYYGRFIPNLASLIHPLNRLLCKDARWNWTKKCAEAFDKAKQALVSSKVLVHYDPSLPLKLAGDASAYGVGAVISHVMKDGSEHPIAFASRTLTSSERNYSQIEKEALSLVFGVKKFHAYLYGRPFTLITDHKPLKTILGPKQGIPTLAAARLQRWALILAAYTYDIEFRSTDNHANADSLSRLPLKDISSDEVSSEPSVFNISQIESLPVTTQQLQAATRTDHVLSKVLHFMKRGWPSKVNAVLRPYWTRRQELTVEHDCVLWGIRAVIPVKLRQKLLDELHRDHPGICRMKIVARGYMWWPGLDQALVDLVKSCQACQSVKHSPSVVPMHPWVWPKSPWQRVHLDFAGPFQGHMFLVAVDAHSKWPEVAIMKSTTSAKTIEVLRTMFSAHGLPEQIVTDNGPQFVSEDFEAFLKQNGIKHIRTAPYHPSSNGLAERFVQSLKLALKASLNSGMSLTQRLSNYLLTYRTTPHATTGVSPCSLFLHRHIRTRLDLLRPDAEAHVTRKQAQQKCAYDRRAHDRELFVGQSVMAKNLHPGLEWIPAIVVERLGPVMYLVETSDHRLWKRHIDQLKEFVKVSREQVRSDVDDSMAFDESIPGARKLSPTSSSPMEDTNRDVSNDQSPAAPICQPDAMLPN